MARNRLHPDLVAMKRRGEQAVIIHAPANRKQRRALAHENKKGRPAMAAPSEQSK